MTKALVYIFIMVPGVVIVGVTVFLMWIHRKGKKEKMTKYVTYPCSSVSIRGGI